jgi:hypothetical protein
MDDTDRGDFQQAYDEAEEALKEALVKAEELAGACDKASAGENGMAGARLRAYLIPHLESWLNDEDQIGSLPATMRDVESAEDEADEEYDTLDEDECLTCELPQSECVCE